MIRGVEVPRMVFWHDSRSSRRNNQVDAWSWSLENGVLASAVSQQGSSLSAYEHMNVEATSLSSYGGAAASDATEI
eukprot:9419295-Pyramimonas_sp.AAC.1